MIVVVVYDSYCCVCKLFAIRTLAKSKVDCALVIRVYIYLFTFCICSTGMQTHTRYTLVKPNVVSVGVLVIFDISRLVILLFPLVSLANFFRYM